MTEGTACRLSPLLGFLELIPLGEYRHYNWNVSSEHKSTSYMPSEVLENTYDISNMDSPFPPPPVCHLCPSSSMESIGSEGMQLSVTPETNSSFEADAEMTWDPRYPYHQSGMAQMAQK